MFQGIFLPKCFGCWAHGGWRGQALANQDFIACWHSKDRWLQCFAMPIEVIAHYRVTRKLGAGGMGEVYLAEDSRLERQVALKLLPSEYAADPERRQRFMTEAKAASALNHPNVCVVYEVGETDDHRPYIAMEFVEGAMLDGRLKQGSVSIREVVSVGLQVADALEAAHGRGGDSS